MLLFFFSIFFQAPQLYVCAILLESPFKNFTKFPNRAYGILNSYHIEESQQYIFQ